ncbi:hypothetical protein T4E_9104 [Trichinella pseudospiralis]|uniref:Uncharacterized protein n=1 Tax=Trichinella pseudospiralis TaxID=6337 RepID=A0A0V0XSZ8_TRIPS|nr:hypothetical protein T4E_9104 [Trichinella pseudospiralis]
MATLRYSVITTTTLSGRASKAIASYPVAHNVQISRPKSTRYSAGRPFAECCMRKPHDVENKPLTRNGRSAL